MEDRSNPTRTPQDSFISLEDIVLSLNNVLSVYPEETQNLFAVRAPLGGNDLSLVGMVNTLVRGPGNTSPDKVLAKVIDLDTGKVIKFVSYTVKSVSYLED